MEYVFGDIHEIKNGKNQRAVENQDGLYPIYGSGGVIGHADDYICEADTVIIGRKGSINNPIYVAEPFWNVDTIYYTEIKTDIISAKFFYHYIVNEHIEKFNTSNASRPALTKAVLDKIDIPIPHVDEQQRIVSILDRFKALTTDLQSSLPAEIEARRKQYEYYREKLLTFKRKAA